MEVVLADSYALYLKTQNFHWNVEGNQFFSLHNLFEEQYTELAAAIDEIAETIRQLGQKAPGGFSKFINLTSIEEGNEDAKAEEMVTQLVADQQKVMDSITEALNIAQEVDDEVTIGILVDRLSAHRKAKWMLSATAKS